MATLEEIRAALDARFGSDFVSEIGRLERELQRLYGETLEKPEMTAQRFRLAQMLASMQELRRLLDQASSQGAALVPPSGASPRPA